MNVEERYSRQSGIIPGEKLNTLHATVIGTGAIGRNVAIQLASIGCQNLKIIDFDTVEESNVASQGFLETNIGVKKVDAVAAICKGINSNINLTVIDGRYKRNMDVGDIVFFCVDSMEIRTLIWENVKEKASLMIDGRMSAETLRVITIEDKISAMHYPTTLFNDSEAFAGSCTAKTTIYCANIAAGYMVSSLAKWLREIPNDPDVLYNLISNEVILNKIETAKAV